MRHYPVRRPPRFVRQIKPEHRDAFMNQYGLVRLPRFSDRFIPQSDLNTILNILARANPLVRAALQECPPEIVKDEDYSND